SSLASSSLGNSLAGNFPLATSRLGGARGGLEEGGHHVQGRDVRRYPPSGRLLARQAHDERDPQRLLVQVLSVAEIAVLQKFLPMVRRDDEKHSVKKM